MQDKKQFEQLMLQYAQLKNGSEEIAKMLEKEDYDGAITMIHAREEIFLSCKCMRNYLDLTPQQQEEADALLDEIREQELKNMKKLERDMDEVKLEIKKSQKNQKLQQTYNFNADATGSILNIQE